MNKVRFFRVTIPLARRPNLWLTSIRAAYRFVPNTPLRNGLLPSRDFLTFRMQVYGRPFSEIPSHEFIRYLEWCKHFPNKVI
jgi:hypothetical protein